MTELAESPARPPEPAPWPAVTVITPTLGNRADLLGQVLDAIKSQDYPGVTDSIVVLDVRSAEGLHATAAAAEHLSQTRAVAEAAGARVIENDRTPGLAGSRNTGILAAATELVAFCDDDDFWLPGKLVAQVRALISEPAAALACCGITVESAGNAIERVHPGETVTFAELLRSRLTALHVSTFVARRAALMDAVGLVSEEIPRRGLRAAAARGPVRPGAERPPVRGAGALAHRPPADVRPMAAGRSGPALAPRALPGVRDGSGGLRADRRPGGVRGRRLR